MFDGLIGLVNAVQSEYPARRAAGAISLHKEMSAAGYSALEIHVGIPADDHGLTTTTVAAVFDGRGTVVDSANLQLPVVMSVLGQWVIDKPGIWEFPAELQIQGPGGREFTGTDLFKAYSTGETSDKGDAIYVVTPVPGAASNLAPGQAHAIIEDITRQKVEGLDLESLLNWD